MTGPTGVDGVQPLHPTIYEYIIHPVDADKVGGRV